MADDNVIRREFQAELTPVGDGRTLDVRIVPYNKPTSVSDGGPRYQEEWLPGVFDKQIKAANRVWVNVEHEKGFRGVVGKGAEFRDEPDAFYGTVRIDEGPEGDKALRYVNEDILTGISLEAEPLKSQRTADGVVQRVKARLVNIALCRNPAFGDDSVVLAVREAPDGEPEPDPEPAEPTPDPEPEPERTAEVLSRIGYESLATRTTTDKPWDGKATRFDDEQFAASCLVHRDGEHVLPVLEPTGELNVHAMRQAANQLNLLGLDPRLKGQAARKLVRYYRLAGEDAPPNVLAAARK